MKISPQIEEFWREFRAANPQVTEPFQVWHFGFAEKGARELLALVLEGKKTATASLVWDYEDRPGDAPVLGGYSVVTDFAGAPQCVLRTTELRVLPYSQVDAEFAFEEGEGDRSLELWRQVHWDCFAPRCVALGKEPSHEMLIYCERFELLFQK